jgi:hypothetical protein
MYFFRALVDLQDQVSKRKDEVKALSLLLSNKTMLEKEVLDYETKCQEIQAEVLKFRKLSMELCSKLIRDSFKIQGKQRINQNSELSKQLDELGTTQSKAGSPANSRRSYRSELDAEELLTPLGTGRTGKNIHETIQLQSLPERNSNDIDPALIWQIPKQKRVLTNLMKKNPSLSHIHSQQVHKNEKEKKLIPSFSMGDL